MTTPAGPPPGERQPASAGPAGGSGDDRVDSRDRLGPAAAGTAGTGEAAGPADRESHASLLAEDERHGIVTRWKAIQADFVDEPRRAVAEADALVTELMQRLAATFAREHTELEQRWAGGTEVSTEDLRQSLRRYRSFFERLLAA